MASRVIYTAIFGDYDILQDPKVKPEGWDFVCFSDQHIQSRHWQIRVVEPEFDDPTRSARKYKILPHRFLGGYDMSIWIDGNLLVRGDVGELVERYLMDANMAVFSHAEARHVDREETLNSKSSVYEEADDLIRMCEEHGRCKDDPDIIRRQIARYREEGYLGNNGLLLSMVLLRRHNEPDVRHTMEKWWEEIKRGSKRDQLSFNYVAWKTGLDFNYISGNVRNNQWFLWQKHAKK